MIVQFIHLKFTPVSWYSTTEPKYFWNTWVQTPTLLHSDHHLAPPGPSNMGPWVFQAQAPPPQIKCHSVILMCHLSIPPPPSPMSSKIIIWLTPPTPYVDDVIYEQPLIKLLLPRKIEKRGKGHYRAISDPIGLA